MNFEDISLDLNSYVPLGKEFSSERSIDVSEERKKKKLERSKKLEELLLLGGDDDSPSRYSNAELLKITKRKKRTTDKVIKTDFSILIEGKTTETLNEDSCAFFPPETPVKNEKKITDKILVPGTPDDKNIADNPKRNLKRKITFDDALCDEYEQNTAKKICIDIKVDKKISEEKSSNEIQSPSEEGVTEVKKEDTVTELRRSPRKKKIDCLMKTPDSKKNNTKKNSDIVHETPSFKMKTTRRKSNDICKISMLAQTNPIAKTPYTRSQTSSNFQIVDCSSRSNSSFSVSSSSFSKTKMPKSTSLSLLTKTVSRSRSKNNIKIKSKAPTDFSGLFINNDIEKRYNIRLNTIFKEVKKGEISHNDVYYGKNTNRTNIFSDEVIDKLRTSPRKKAEIAKNRTGRTIETNNQLNFSHQLLNTRNHSPSDYDKKQLKLETGSFFVKKALSSPTKASQRKIEKLKNM
uniref:Shugoshin_C domain-containing protein n=1 Tax=Strongyloides papillosus TaxID=174720 RepID=A0A0N5BWP9_STREA